MDAAATPAGALRVGLAHGSVAGRLPDDADAANPIAADRATGARLDYLALGDWHGTLEIAPRTWYAGTPEPDRFRANDAGNALLVELDGPGLPRRGRAAADRPLPLARAQPRPHRRRPTPRRAVERALADGRPAAAVAPSCACS